MNITSGGVTFEEYVRANPSAWYSEFTDADGATLRIKTTTLIKMYELVKFDLERQGSFETVVQSIEQRHHV